MSKLIVIVGATGTQGKSVVDRFLKDNSFTIRGLTRNVDSEKAKALSSQGIQMHAADVDDEESLVKAFSGAHIIFGMTDFSAMFHELGSHGAMEREYERGVKIARAASRTETLEHFIWSTLPYSERLSGGKMMVPHFDGKARVDEFIKQDEALVSKTTFLYLTLYASVFQWPLFEPHYFEPAQRYLSLLPLDGATPIFTAGNVSLNVGIWVYAAVKSTKLRTLRTNEKPAVYVLSSHDTTPSSDLIKAWVRTSAPDDKKESPSSVVPVSLEQFGEIWGPMGTEVGTMLQLWGYLKEKSWDVAGEGDVLVKVQELMNEGLLKEQVGTEETFKGLGKAKSV